MSQGSSVGLQVAKVLRAGSVSGAALLVVGLVLSLLRVSQPGPEALPSLRELVRQTWNLEPLALTEWGILVLLLTPVAAVLTTAWSYFRQGDRRSLVISLGVLGLLVLAALVGRG